MLFRPWISSPLQHLTAHRLEQRRGPRVRRRQTLARSSLNYSFNRLQTGKPESLCQYRGKGRADRQYR